MVFINETFENKEEHKNFLKVLEEKNIKIFKTTNKIFNELAPRYASRNGGYTQILKLSERRGDGALLAIIKLVDEETKEETK